MGGKGSSNSRLDLNWRYIELESKLLLSYIEQNEQENDVIWRCVLLFNVNSMMISGRFIVCEDLQKQCYFLQI